MKFHNSRLRLFLSSGFTGNSSVGPLLAMAAVSQEPKCTTAPSVHSLSFVVTLGAPVRVRNSGFSLLEVLIAVGIFSVAVSVILGLLPALTRQSAASADTLNALRLPDALRVELQRMAVAGGFDALAGETRPLATPLPDACRLVATRDAARLHALNFQPPPALEQIDEGAQYFLIEAWSFPAAPLAFDAGRAVLALHVRVSWPYRIPTLSTVIPLADREQITFNVALSR